MRSKTRLILFLAAGFFIALGGAAITDATKSKAVEAHPLNLNTETFNFDSELTTDEIEPLHHQARLNGKLLFDDKAEGEKFFNHGINYESEFRFSDKIHYLISQHSSNIGCPKEYRIITVKDDNDFTVSDAFGKCLGTPTGDKYDDGSMDLLFPEKDGKQLKLFYTSDGKIQNDKTVPETQQDRMIDNK